MRDFKYDSIQKKMEFRLRASREQFLIILEFMEKYGDLSRPEPGIVGRQRSEYQWNELTKLLNSVGENCVQRHTEKWKRVWSDWKTKTKKKAILIKRTAHGGGPGRVKMLNSLEKRVLKIIGFGLPRPKIKQEVLERPPSPVEPVIVPVQFIPEASPNHTFPESSNTTDPIVDNSRSPSEEPLTPRHLQMNSMEQRKRRHQMLFEHVNNNYMRIEEARLRLEEKRLDKEYDIEMERLRLNSRRITMEEQRNDILKGIATTVSNMLELLLRSHTDRG